MFQARFRPEWPAFSIAISSFRDDLRTRSEAFELPHGSKGAETLGSAARTAQMITRQDNGAGKLASLWGDRAGHSLAAAKPHQNGYLREVRSER